MGSAKSFCPRLVMKMHPPTQSIPDRSSPGTRTALSSAHQGGGDKSATDVQANNSMRGRKKFTIGTWNVRTLNQMGKIKELCHELENYQWAVLGLCEARWKNTGELQTDDGHTFYYSGDKERCVHGVAFLVNKEYKNFVIGCQPVSSRIMKIRIRATPLNLTIIQVYAPTTDYDDDQIEEFYQQLQQTIDKVHKKDILIVQGDWNARIGLDALPTWKDNIGRALNTNSNDRGLRLLEFAKFNNMVVANTLGNHKKSRSLTWHAPNGINHHQIDYILIDSRYKTSVNYQQTRTFPGADIGSDHDLVLMNMKIRLKKETKPKKMRVKFNLDKLQDPNIAEVFRATIGGKFGPLLTLGEDLETTTTEFNKIMTETAEEILGQERRKKKPWITDNILDMCDRRRELKKQKTSARGREEHAEINRNIRKEMKSAKQKWVEEQCKEVEDNMSRNNTKKVYDKIKDLTREKKSTVTIIADKEGNILTEEQEIHQRWTEYCKDLYNTKTTVDPTVLQTEPHTNEEEEFNILRSEVERAVKELKAGKSPGVDNIPAELLKAGGDTTIDILHQICNNIWETGIWPSPWTQSLIITLPKKGNLQLCQNYRTISLISHASKVMLKIILRRLKPQAEAVIAEEQAGFREGRSTIEQIFNLRLLCEKHREMHKELHHIFIDFKKAFDRVWHEALWDTMKRYNMGNKIIQSIQNLYEKASSAVLYKGTVGDWFHTSVGVRQGCLLSPTLFNIFLEKIMTIALQDHQGTISIGGRNITNLRFADDIDGLAGSEQELRELTNKLNETSKQFGMEISAEKTKIMSNRVNPINLPIEINGVQLQCVQQFKYLGSIIHDEGSTKEILSRIAQATSALQKLKTIWKDNNITMKHKIQFIRALVFSIFLYASETWTLNQAQEKKIAAFEMRCYRTIMGITYLDRIRNEEIRDRVRSHIGEHENLITTIRKRKLKWYGHVTRSSGLAKTILQGRIEGTRRRGRPNKQWLHNITEWTGKSVAETSITAHDRKEWRKLVDRNSTWRPNDS